MDQTHFSSSTELEMRSSKRGLLEPNDSASHGWFKQSKSGDVTERNELFQKRKNINQEIWKHQQTKELHGKKTHERLRLSDLKEEGKSLVACWFSKCLKHLKRHSRIRDKRRNDYLRDVTKWVGFPWRWPTTSLLNWTASDDLCQYKLRQRWGKNQVSLVLCC